MGCLKLKGGAKTLDIAILHSDIMMMLHGLMDLANNMDICMQKMELSKSPGQST